MSALSNLNFKRVGGTRVVDSATRPEPELEI